MADVQSFRGLRYALGGEALASVVAPPYDVIGQEDRQALLALDDRNIVTVDIAADGYDAAAARWRSWREDGVIVQEPRPALYAYKQTFKGPDGSIAERLGVMGAVRLAAYEKGVVLPHERTLTGPKADRLELMRATRTQLSPVFGLHFGAAASIEALLAPACGGEDDAKGPDMAMTDPDGVRNEMWVLTDPDLLQAISEALEPARIVIADGHHRYETALAFRDEQRARLGASAEHDNAAWNYVQMMLVDIESPGLVVFPTHRILRPLAGVDAAEASEALNEAFEVTPLEAAGDASGAARRALERLGGAPGFVLYGSGGRLWLVRLTDEQRWRELTKDKPDAWRDLDVAVMHKLALPRIGLDDDRQSSGDYMSYTYTAEDAIAAVERGEGSAALLVRPTPSTAVKDVALAGQNMPQKSTYYYPKLLTGLVMSDLDTDVGL